jgi:tetratricopeptide (TPR) repeat protein
MASDTLSPSRPRRDYRPLALVMVAITVVALGFLVDRLPGRGTEASLTPKPVKHGQIKADLTPFAGIPDSPEKVAREEAARESTAPLTPEEAEKRELRKEARMLLASRDFKAAIAPLQKLIARAPQDAQAHVLMGLALEGSEQFAKARQFYEAAIDRDLQMADAYFGYATTSEALGDIESALGGMRSFLHVQHDDDPYRLRVAQARSAIWEWESKLGRGDWGPTRGIPPGFTEAELRRDGKGVGTKMPIPGTQQADGSSKYEIKHGDKIEMFKK